MTTRLSRSALAILLGLTISTQASLADGPRDAVPDFGPNVLIFDHAISHIQEQLGIEAPKAEGIKMYHLFTIRLGGGRNGSGIRHVINNAGGPVITTRKATIDNYP